MPSLPAVFVELKATTDDFRAKFADAEKTVKNFSDQSTTGLQKMQQVGGVAFAAIGAAAVTFGTIAVKAALDGEQAHAQLVNAVQNSGTAFDNVSGQVDQMSEKFAKLGYENDEVEAALARLVQATGSTSTGMQNMGLAADLARARNMSLTDAATALGKILDGNLRGMQAFGLSTKDAAGNTLTTAAAVKELNDRFGGAAQASAGTYMGSLQALNAEWKNMTEAVGQELLPVLASLAGDAANVVGWLDQHRAVALALAGVVGGPLVVAMSSYIAKQTIAFSQGVVGAVKNVATAISGFLVPATEAEEAAMSGWAVAESIVTAGLTVAAGVAAAYVIHQASSKSATDATTASMNDATTAVSTFNATETESGPTIEDTTNKLKDQQKQFENLADDTNAQSSLLLKLVGDQNAVDTATQRLNDTTGANSETTKWATQHTKDLAAANEELQQADDDLTTAIEKQQQAQQHLNDLLKPQSQRNIISAQDDFQAAQDRVAQTSQALTDKQDDLTTAISKYGPNSKEAQQAQWDYNSALRDAHDATNDLTDATQALADAQRPTIGTADEIATANDDLTTASQGVTTAQGKQQSAQQNLTAVQAQDNSAAVAADRQNLATNTLAAANATQQLKSDTQDLMDILGLPGGEQLRQQLITDLQHITAAFPSLGQTGPLKDVMGTLTGPIPPNAALTTVSATLDHIAQWKAPPELDKMITNPALIGGGGLLGTAAIGLGGIPGGPTNQLPGPTYDQLVQWWVQQNPMGAAGGIPSYSELITKYNDPQARAVVFGPGHASGGPVMPGVLYPVGERGPELFAPSTPGTIIPNGGFGGAVTVNVTVQGGFYGDTQALALAVRDELIQHGRRNGGTGLN